eukprot:scaffold16107_cov67-Phaeocystis_antarctica.AAC.10
MLNSWPPPLTLAKQVALRGAVYCTVCSLEIKVVVSYGIRYSARRPRRVVPRPEDEADWVARGGGSGDASRSGRRGGCRAWSAPSRVAASIVSVPSRTEAMRLRARGDPCPCPCPCPCGVSLSNEGPRHASPCHAASASPSTRRSPTTRIAPLGERGGDAMAAAAADPTAQQKGRGRRARTARARGAGAVRAGVVGERVQLSEQGGATLMRGLREARPERGEASRGGERVRGAAVAARLARLARLSCGAEAEAESARDDAVSGRAKGGEAKGERPMSSEGSTPKRSVSSAITTCSGSGSGSGGWGSRCGEERAGDGGGVVVVALGNRCASTCALETWEMLSSDWKIKVALGFSGLLPSLLSRPRLCQTHAAPSSDALDALIHGSGRHAVKGEKLRATHHPSSRRCVCAALAEHACSRDDMRPRRGHRATAPAGGWRWR